jgi:hypothetical protein
MNTKQREFITACVIIVVILILWYYVVNATPSTGATVVTTTTASGTQQSNVVLDSGSTVIIDHGAQTATITMVNGTTTTTDISGLSTNYTPDQIAAVVNITTNTSGPIPQNSIRLFNQAGFQGQSFDLPLDGTELIYTAAGGWDYQSIKVGPIDNTINGGVTLRFSNNDPTSTAILFMNLTADVSDMTTAVGVLPAVSNYATLFNGQQDIYIDFVRYADCVVESEQLKQNCIVNVPGSTYNCLLEFNP